MTIYLTEEVKQFGFIQVLSPLQNMSAHSDRSNGYEAIASDFAQQRQKSSIGLATIKAWARALPPGGTVLDIGCGSGVPISKEMANLGFSVAGIDASPSLIAEFHRQLPTAVWACEAVEDSLFFGRTFDAVIAIGLMFLLSADTQRRVILRVGEQLKDGGHFLFSAPYQICAWSDVLTGQESVSLGTKGYEAVLRSVGLEITGCYVDEGENHYFACRKADSAEQTNKSLKCSCER